MFKRKSKVQKLIEQIMIIPGIFKVYIECSHYDATPFAAIVTWREKDPGITKVYSKTPEAALDQLREKIAFLDQMA